MINKVIKAKVNNIDIDGYAYIKYNRDTIKVKGCNPNELVQIKVINKSKNYYIAQVVKVLEACNRVSSLCNNYSKCGSCSYLQLEYKQQLDIKRKYVEELCKAAKLDIRVHDVVGSKNIYEYRNKIIIGYKYENNKLASGLYEENTHRIVDTKDCLLHDEETNKLIEELNKIIRKYKISIYNEDKRKGFLRHILIRKAFTTNEYLICLVATSNILAGKNNIVKDILKINSNIKSIVLNVNTRKTSIVLGEQEISLYGKHYIRDKLCNKYFNISSKSFYQINHDQCEALYSKALSLLSNSKTDVLLDAYCGIGTIGIIASDRFKKVIGVEINNVAVNDARFNALTNKVNNVKFINADATNYMVNAVFKNEKIDCIIMDPARDGSTKVFMDSLFKLKPKEVVYISCNPDTLINDMKYMSKHYSFSDMYLYDMFPNTSHVEAVVLLSRIQ